MKNQIFRYKMIDGFSLELSIIGTNEIKPFREILAVDLEIIHDNSSTTCCVFEESDLDSLIDYLNKCKSHISEFNKNSKPKLETNEN